MAKEGGISIKTAGERFILSAVCVLFCFLVGTKAEAKEIFCGVYTKNFAQENEFGAYAQYKNTDYMYLTGQNLYAILSSVDNTVEFADFTLYIDGEVKFSKEGKFGWASFPVTYTEKGMHTFKWTGKWPGTGKTFEVYNTIYISKPKVTYTDATHGDTVEGNLFCEI